MDKEQGSRKEKIVAIVEEELRDLIPGYLENRRKDVRDILSAIDRDDFEAIRSMAHKMKGSGGGYGFDGISEIGRACEDAANKFQKKEVLNQVDRLQDYLDRVEVIFEP